MENLISDDFDQHDKVLADVCEKFQFNVQPSWHHKWYFRFLQISYSYSYVRECEAVIKSGGVNQVGYKEHLPDYDLVNMTYQGLYDVWHFDFIRWWAIFGQLQFSRQQDFKCRELGLLEFGRKYNDDQKNIFVNKYIRYIDQVIDGFSYPDVLILGLPMDKPKDVLIKQFIEIIDRYNVYPQPNTAHGNFYIKQTKLKESALRDCYRTFELRVRYPDISLIELAKMSNTLKTSLAGIKDDSESEAAKSVRSGTKQQINMAINIAEAAARGSFPYTKKCIGLHNKYLSEIDYFKQLFNVIQRVTPFKTQDSNLIVKELPEWIRKAEECNLNNLLRLY